MQSRSKRDSAITPSKVNVLADAARNDDACGTWPVCVDAKIRCEA